VIQSQSDAATAFATMLLCACTFTLAWGRGIRGSALAVVLFRSRRRGVCAALVQALENQSA
jgi:hypothetical protein